MVAAMVLTSLSCSPVVQSPPASDSGIPRECALKKNNKKTHFYDKNNNIYTQKWRNTLVLSPDWAGMDATRRSPWCWCWLGGHRRGDPALRDRPRGGRGAPGWGAPPGCSFF